MIVLKIDGVTRTFDSNNQYKKWVKGYERTHWHQMHKRPSAQFAAQNGHHVSDITVAARRSDLGKVCPAKTAEDSYLKKMESAKYNWY